jgi:O-antigen/teichoic acid export membrane protein
LTWLVDIGTGAALVTLVARSNVHKITDEARQYLAGALGLGCGLAALTLVTTAALLLACRVQGQTYLYLIVATGLALNVPLSTANNMWLALQKGHISALWESVQTILTISGLTAAVMLTRDLRIYVGVVYAGLLFANLGSLVHLFITYPDLRPDHTDISLAPIKEVSKQGVMYFGLGIAGGLSFFVDNILALEWLGPEASARMTIAMRICFTAMSMLAVLAQPLWPAFAEAAERSDKHWIHWGLIRGMVTLAVFTGSASFVLILWGKKLLLWWLHTDIGIGQGLLFAIAIWIVVQALSVVPNLLLNGLSILRFQIFAYSISTLIALGLKFALVRRLGVQGILLGTTIATAAIVIPANIWRIRRWIKQSSHIFLDCSMEYPLGESTIASSRASEGNSRIDEQVNHLSQTTPITAGVNSQWGGSYRKREPTGLA